MTGNVFVERACAVGGCGCGHWDAWWLARREFAKRHPRARALDAISDDTAYSEALDDLAEELDAEFRFVAPACRRAGCARAA